MIKRKTMKKKRNNTGFSIVELIVAIGILGVIGTIVALLMTSSSRNYNRMSIEAQLQSEAQLVANSISEYAIDSYDAMGVVTVLPASFPYVNTDGKILTLRSREKDSSGNWITMEYVIALNATQNKLYLLDRKLTDVNDPATWGAFTHSLLGNNITDFNVDLSHVSSDNLINFKLKYTKDQKEYEGSYQVLMRNKAYADSTPTSTTPGVDAKLLLGVSPKQVYIDVVGGEAGNYYYINSVIDGAGLSIPTDGIPFTATATSSQSGVTNDVTWELSSNVSHAFNFTPDSSTQADTAKLQLKDISNFNYDDLTIDDFSLSISKSITASDGTVVSASPKQAKVHLRRVKSINLIATSGSTTWKKTYEDMGGTESLDADVKGYCYADTRGNYNNLNLNAAIIQKWVPYGGGLVWKLEMKPVGSSDWTADVSHYARLQNNETDNSTMNSVIFERTLVNGQLFRVTATSKFDPSKSASYVFGVAPWRSVNNDGIYSRGFYVNLNQYFLNTDFGSSFKGNQADLRDAVRNNKNIRVRLGTMGSQFEANAVKLIQDEYGEWYMYIDYNSYMYSYGTQAVQFYSEGTNDIELYIELLDDAGNVIQTLANPMYYFVAPVLVQPTNTTSGVIVLSPGSTYDLKTQTNYYNILGEDYIGVYINDGDSADANYAGSTVDADYNKFEQMFSSNLNTGGKYDTDRYLTAQVTSGYGDVKTYVDVVNVALTAKTPNNVRNANPMKVRVTADKYYKLVIGNYSGTARKDRLYVHDSGRKWRYDNSTVCYTAPMTEYTVVTANVVGENTFIVGPSTVSGDLKFDVATIKTRGSSNAVGIDGYNSDGVKVTNIAYAYYENGSYKCKYKGNVYTYSQVRHTWSK